jgi:hypothetical protein
MIRKSLLVLSLLAASIASAQTSTRNPAPDDFTPTACAEPSRCTTFPKSAFLSAAGTFTGKQLEPEWMDAHWDEFLPRFQNACSKMAACYAVPGNTFVFCNDVIMHRVNACEEYEANSSDRYQCEIFVKTWLKGKDGTSRADFDAVQKCASSATTTGTRKMDLWFDKEAYELGDEFTIFALDSETHVPLQAPVAVSNIKNVYSRDTVDGRLYADFPVPSPLRLERAPNAKTGHRDVRPPTVSVTMAGYEPVTLTIPLRVPQMIVELDPKASTWKPGKNTITVKAVDSVTGKPVDARVMAGDTVLGKTNTPLTFAVTAGKRPEIWVTSLYDRYSDAIVLPAK